MSFHVFMFLSWFLYLLSTSLFLETVQLFRTNVLWPQNKSKTNKQTKKYLWILVNYVIAMTWLNVDSSLGNFGFVFLHHKATFKSLGLENCFFKFQTLRCPGSCYDLESGDRSNKLCSLSTLVTVLSPLSGDENAIFLSSCFNSGHRHRGHSACESL